MKLDVRRKIQAFWQQFSYHQQRQLLMAFLVIFLVSSLILGFLQLRYYILSPLVYFQANPDSFNQPLDEEEVKITEIRAAQQADTDEDGLNDYDERFVYNTSPFIQDTDSDGFSDKQEADSGNNPTCPSGQSCLGGTDSSSGSAVDSDILANPEELRVALMNYGFSEQQVKAMSDEQLRAQYVAIVSNEGTNTPTPTEADQLRSAILQAGIVDEQTLNTLSDEEIVRIYKETIGGSD